MPSWECLVNLCVDVVTGEVKGVFLGEINGVLTQLFIGGLVGEIGELTGEITGGVGETISDANGVFKGG